jgi:hypothetical protein
MRNIGPLDPKRWILGWLCLDSTNGEVFRIHPDPATVEKLSCDLRFNLKSVWAAFIGSAISD